jgi:hypothetical protein
MFSIFHLLILVDLLFLLAHNKMIKQEIMSKESEITQLKAALQEEKHANGRLRADIKLKSQDLKVHS